MLAILGTAKHAAISGEVSAMEFLRKAAKTWVAKLLLILLVASFAVWGLSGAMIHGQSSTVVSVGDQNVSPTEFLLSYQQQVGAMSQRFGRRLSTEEARAFGIEEQVFSSLASNAALDQQAEDLNLGVSIAQQDEIIMQSPLFQDRVTGNFDPTMFSLVLRNAGLTEKQYFDISAKEAKRAQIVDAAIDGFEVPDIMVKALGEHRAERRDIDYLILTPDLLGEIAEPTDEQLQTYFDDNLSNYAAPEYRKIAYVRLLAEDILVLDDVSAEDISNEYEARKSSYVTQEQRTFDQITFADDVSAQAALAKLNSGSSFEDLLKEEGKTASDVAIGTFTKETVPNPDFADAIFSVFEAGGYTDVLDGTFGPVIIHVSAIEPGTTQSLDDVSNDIRRELALITANEALFDVYDGFEDDRGSGMTLLEAANKQNLAPITLEAIDQFGRDENDEPVLDIPLQSQLLQQAFDSDIGLDVPALNIGSNGFVWFEVLDITPERDRTLDEVKDRVVADWKMSETDRLLSEKANELLAQLQDGSSLFELGDANGLSVEKKIDASRSDADAIFGRSALETAFAGPLGQTGLALDATGNNQIILKVVGKNVPGTLGNDEALEQDAMNMSLSTGNEIANQLVVRLQNEYGATVNRELATRLLSQSAGGL